MYEDTPDQAKSTADVKQDMEAPFPMDRLVCGDVGFGKTEVAVRAAFKSVMSGAAEFGAVVGECGFHQFAICSGFGAPKGFFEAGELSDVISGGSHLSSDWG